MKRVASLIVLSFIAGGAAAATDIPAAVLERRDLRGYDDGGVYRASGYIVAEVQRLRDFIWTHWTQKRRGYVEIVFQDVDTGIKAYVYIEPVNGRWGIG